MRVTVTRRLRKTMARLSGEEYWERLSDITEHPVEWLQNQVSRSGIKFKLVKESEDYGKVTEVY